MLGVPLDLGFFWLIRMSLKLQWKNVFTNNKNVDLMPNLHARECKLVRKNIVPFPLFMERCTFYTATYKYFGALLYLISYNMFK